jgi:hypothetical protein
VATIDHAEHAFTAFGIYPYRPNIISDKDVEPSEVTRKDKTRMICTAGYDESGEATQGLTLLTEETQDLPCFSPRFMGVP